MSAACPDYFHLQKAIPASFEKENFEEKVSSSLYSGLTILIKSHLHWA